MSNLDQENCCTECGHHAEAHQCVSRDGKDTDACCVCHCDRMKWPILTTMIEPTPTNDDRPFWEIVYCLKFKLAASYLDAYSATGTQANLLRTAYETRDLKQWAQERIEMLLEECETTRAGRLLSIAARSAVADSKDDLLQAGWCGTVLTPSAGIMKTNQRKNLDSGDRMW